MTNTEFNRLIKGTKIGKKGTKSLEAARLYFVNSFGNISACAKKADCSHQTVNVTIKRIKELIAAQGMEAVTVLVPKGMKKEVENLAIKLRSDTT